MSTKVMRSKNYFENPWTGADWIDHLAEVVFNDHPPYSKHTSFTLARVDFDKLKEELSKRVVWPVTDKTVQIKGIPIIPEDRLSPGECWGHFDKRTLQ